MEDGISCGYINNDLIFRSRYRVVTKIDFSLFSETMVYVDRQWGRFAPVDISRCSKSCILNATS